jgi:putative DNA primase/helicase
MTDDNTRDSSGEIVAYNINDFLLLKLPEREYIVEPIIPTQGIVMLYAQRGIGKTFLALSIACAVAIGVPILCWKVPKPRHVVYVDGEMSGQTIQERLCGIISGINVDFSDANSLKIINVTLQDRCLDLSKEEDQKLLEPHLRNVDFLVLDNISTLTSVKENDADSWLNIQKWLIGLRQRNTSVLLIHHAGKNGNQRGSCRKEDILDTVIALKRPGDYENREGSKFEVKFEKCRGFSGDDAKPFEAQLEGNTEEGFVWKITDSEAATKSRIEEMIKIGMTQREIAVELGISQTSVSRIKNEKQKLIQ